MPAPDMPSVQRGIAPKISIPALPFDIPAAVDVPTVKQPEVPEISRTQPSSALETTPTLTSVPVSSSPVAVQRESESAASAPTLSRDLNHSNRTRFGRQATAGYAAVERSAASGKLDKSAPSIPFDEPVISEPYVPHVARLLPDASPLQQSEALTLLKRKLRGCDQHRHPLSNGSRSLLLLAINPFDVPVDVQPAASNDSQPAPMTCRRRWHWSTHPRRSQVGLFNGRLT